MNLTSCVNDSKLTTQMCIQIGARAKREVGLTLKLLQHPQNGEVGMRTEEIKLRRKPVSAIKTNYPSLS